MFSLWIPACAGVTLAGCQQKAASADHFIACQPKGAPAFSQDCTVERSDGPDGATLTLRHADGRFRRLLITQDGQGVIAADGAELAIVRMNAGREIEVMVAGDRYRLPARSKQQAGTKP
jgi:hypothetical protein